MYNLIVTAEAGAWDRGRYALHRDRFCEYTAEPIKARHAELDDSAVQELTSLPTLLAYEDPQGLPGQLARITRMRRTAQVQMRFDFQIIEEVSAIPSHQISEMAWDLDIHDWEMNRTHWAIKDIELLPILRHSGIEVPTEVDAYFRNRGSSTLSDSNGLRVNPRVFSVPSATVSEDSVAVMMPFEEEFRSVYETIQQACSETGLRCRRADDVWLESTIIQEVFNLIFKSSFVIADLTGRNANVMYETGIAHTLGRDVVPIAQNVQSVPFDLTHHRVLEYLPNEQGLRELKENLQGRLRVLSSGPNRSS